MRYNKRFNETLEDHAGQAKIHPRGGVQGPAGAGVREIDTHSLSVGLEAGNAWVATSIEDSIAIGYQSQHDNEGGTYITTLGVRSFGSMVHDYGPYSVIGIGADTGFGVATPDDEIYIGDRILSAANVGISIYGNIIIGHDNLLNTTTFDGYNNVIIGHDLMQDAPCTDAGYNVIIGSDTIGDAIDEAYANFIAGLGTCESLTNGSFNVVIGNYAGYGLTIGDSNVYLGNGAGGWGVAAHGPTTGDYNIFIGDNAGHELDGDSTDNICIGDNAGPTTHAEYNGKGWIDYTVSDTPCLGFDFNESRVGFSANVSSLTNIIHVVAGSATDPIADSWTTHASSRKEKEIIGIPDDKKILDSIRKTEIYNYKRKVELIEAEKQRIVGQYEKAKRKSQKDVKIELTEEDRLEIDKRYNAKLTGKEKLNISQKEKIRLQIEKNYTKKKQSQSRYAELTEDDLKEIDKLHDDHLQAKSKLPKFTTERMGIMIDDDNVPSEILTFDEAGNKNGIDLLAYIGYLHGAIKALTTEVDTLKGV